MAYSCSGITSDRLGGGGVIWHAKDRTRLALCKEAITILFLGPQFPFSELAMWPMRGSRNPLQYSSILDILLGELFLFMGAGWV